MYMYFFWGGVTPQPRPRVEVGRKFVNPFVNPQAIHHFLSYGRGPGPGQAAPVGADGCGHIFLPSGILVLLAGHRYRERKGRRDACVTTIFMLRGSRTRLRGVPRGGRRNCLENPVPIRGQGQAVKRRPRHYSCSYSYSCS